MAKEMRAAVMSPRKSNRGLHQPCHLFISLAAAKRKSRARRDPSKSAVRKAEAAGEKRLCHQGAASKRAEKGTRTGRQQCTSRCAGGSGRGPEVTWWRWLGPAYPAPLKGTDTKTAGEGGKDQIRFSFYELVSVHLSLSLALCRYKCHSAGDCISSCHSSNYADAEIHFLGFQHAVDTSL